MRIVVIGSGYVGLVSGACFADFGHDVICIDKDQAKIAKLEAGIMPIYEPGLDALVESNRRAGRLTFLTDLKAAVGQDAEVVFLAVGTPSRRGDGHADLSFVYQAAREVAEAAVGPLVVTTKSTVPVGTGDEVERIVRKARPDLELTVASNPEFLREGSAIEDFKRPDRIVVGCEDQRSREVMTEVYRPLYLNQPPIMFTGRRTSELIKYAANAFLATKITFINEMADLCEQVGANVQEVARGIGLDNRIGSKFLHAGPGYGGSCFPKDTLALVKTAQDFAAPLRIVETVAVLGLTFKPNTDDMRDAPSIALVTALEDQGAIVRGYDPEGMEQARQVMPQLKFCDSAYGCLEGADVMVVCTEWNEFRGLDMRRVKSLLKAPVVVDLRNIYRPDEMARQGFTYVSVGRPSITG